MLRRSKRMMGMAVLIVLSVALLIGLLSQITVRDIKRLTAHLDGAELTVLCGLYMLTAYFRGIRLGYIIREKNHARLTSIAAIHAFLNLMLPFRLGELSLPFLIKACTTRGIGVGSFSLLVVRLYDGIAIASLSVFALVAVDIQSNPSLESVLWILSLAVIIGFVLVFRYLDRLVMTVAVVVCRLLGMMGSRGKKAAVKLDQVGHHIIEEIGALTAHQKYIFLPVTSVAVCLLTYTMFYLTMVFMDINIGFFLNVLASLGDLVGSILPSAFGSFGTLEAGWAAGYVLCGVSKADAIATGFIMHGVIILSGLVLSMGGTAYLLAERGKLKRERVAMAPQKP